MNGKCKTGPSPPAVDFRNVGLRYQSPEGETEALKGLSFTVNEGEFLVLLGPSGCGKTTVLSLIAGLIKPSEGEIRIGGEILTEEKRPQIGYMFQHDELLPWARVIDNVLLGCRIRKEDDLAHRKRAAALLDEYGLGNFRESFPRSLSGGMRQRAALIRTLATDPSLLLLDEPFSALDYQTRIRVSEDIASIIKREGKTAVMVTHDISEALSLADRILVLSSRPASVKRELPLEIDGRGVIQRRASPLFADYFNLIWKELDDENAS